MDSEPFRNFSKHLIESNPCLGAVQGTQVLSLGREDPLEKEMATHSSILAWKIPWTDKPGRLQTMGSHCKAPCERLPLSHTHTHLFNLNIKLGFVSVFLTFFF